MAWGRSAPYNGAVEGDDPGQLRRARRHRILALAALALVAWSGSVVRGGFALDDREVLEGNPAVGGELPWGALLVRDYWAHHPASAAGHYRPAAVASLRVDRWLWGDGAAGYHGTNAVLHALVVALAAALAARVADGPWPWFGLALFAVHPALADSVAWISGRTSMLSALGGLAGALAVAHLVRCERGAGAGIATALAAALGLTAALLGKEDGIVFAPLLVLVALGSSRRAALASGVGCALGIGGYLVLRHAALGQWLPAAPHAPLAQEPLLERLRVAGGALAEGLRVGAWPVGYPPGWEVEDFAPTPWALALPAWLALGAALGGGTLAAFRGAGRAAGASLALAAAAVLPLAQLVPSGEVLAPRFLYLPLLLGAPFVHGCWTALFGDGGRAALLGALVLAACVPAAWSRASVYGSRASYWEAHLPHHPDSPRVWNGLGNARAEAGDREGARGAWERAIQVDPTYSRPWTNLAGLAVGSGDLERGEELLRRALAAGPANPVAWANLGSVLLRRKRPDEARVAYERAVGLSPGSAALWRGLARARRATGDAAGALSAVEEALRLDPGDRRAAALRATLRAALRGEG